MSDHPIQLPSRVSKKMTSLTRPLIMRLGSGHLTNSIGGYNKWRVGIVLSEHTAESM